MKDMIPQIAESAKKDSYQIPSTTILFVSKKNRGGVKSVAIPSLGKT